MTIFRTVAADANGCLSFLPGFPRDTSWTTLPQKIWIEKSVDEGQTWQVDPSQEHNLISAGYSQKIVCFVNAIPEPTPADMKRVALSEYDETPFSARRSWIRRAVHAEKQAEHERNRAEAAERELDELRKLLERAKFELSRLSATRDDIEAALDAGKAGG